MDADLVLRFLRTSGPDRDVDLFLSAYGAGQGGAIALIVDGPDRTRAAEAVVPALAHLQMIGLRPVIIQGLFSPSEAPSFGERLRAMAAPVCSNHDLFAPLNPLARNAGGPQCITFKPASAPFEVRAAMLADRLRELGARKVVLLDSAGALFINGEPQSVYLSDHAVGDAVPIEGAEAAQAELSEWAAALASLGSPYFSVSMASPMNLLNELFTVRGAGTLFRPPAQFDRQVRLEDAAKRRLARIIERAFGQTLASSWEPRDLQEALIEQYDRAAAVVLGSPYGRYLSKFAVIRECQGAGLGAELWSKLTACGQPLFWRARPDNPINGWYSKVADETLRGARWTFFSIGLESASKEHAIEYAFAQPSDLE